MKKCPRCNGQYEDSVRFCPRDGVALPEIIDPMVGQVLLGQFEILSSCGRGAMGTVYRARQTTMDRVVAIKVLRRELVRDPAVVKRFQREARAVGRLQHPNIVTVFLIGETDDGLPYLVMELVEGESLGAICARECPLPPARALGIARQIGSALGEAHAAGVVHRDLKPENITVATRRRTADFVKVLDFGIAKIVGAKSNVSHLTRTGAIFGTPHYISPEQASGGEVDSRADLYSLGVILFRMLTGRLPFDAAGGMQVLLQHIREQPPRPRDLNPALSPELEQLILRALAKDPAARWQSADELCEEIDLLPEVRAADRSARETWAGVGAPALAVVAAGLTGTRPVAPGATALGVAPVARPAAAVPPTRAVTVAPARAAAAQPAAAAASSVADTSPGSRLAQRPGADGSPLPSTVAAMAAAAPDSVGLEPPRYRGARFLGVAALVVALAGGLAAAVYIARDRVQARPAAAPADAAPRAPAAGPDAGVASPAAAHATVDVVTLTLGGYAVRVSYPAHPTAKTDTTFWVDVRDRQGRPLESARVTLGLRAPRARGRDKEQKCPGKASAMPGRYAAECHLKEAGTYHARVYLQAAGQQLQQGFDVVVAELAEPHEARPRGGTAPARPEPGAKPARGGGKPAGPDAGAAPPAAAPPPWPQPPQAAPPPPRPEPAPPPPPPDQPVAEPPPRPAERPPPDPPPRRPARPDDIYQILDGGT